MVTVDRWISINFHPAARPLVCKRIEQAKGLMVGLIVGMALAWIMRG